MILRKIFVIFSLFISTIIFAEAEEVNKLFEKVNQAPSAEVKKELIEELKIKLAEENIKAREEADAIIKAKEKMPLKLFNDKNLGK